MRGGRGLELGHPDLIPLERVDILEDLKQIVDVHRLTDFSVHDRIVPTIELRRTEDLLVFGFFTTLGQLAANFSIIQLFNQTLFANIRPLAATVLSDQTTKVQVFLDAAAQGAQVTTGFILDRRKGALAFPGGAVPGAVRTNQAVAVPGQSIYQVSGPAIGAAYDAPGKLLENIVLPPGTGISFAPAVVNAALNVAVAYLVQQINPTRPLGA